MSDGTDVLRFLEPQTYKMVRQIEVRDRGNIVPNINDLEYIRGQIYANVWGQRISSAFHRVQGKYLAGSISEVYANMLVHAERRTSLNGIAYDVKGNRLFVTGKYWPNIFEIR